MTNQYRFQVNSFGAIRGCKIVTLSNFYQCSQPRNLLKFAERHVQFFPPNSKPQILGATCCTTLCFLLGAITSYRQLLIATSYFLQKKMYTSNIIFLRRHYLIHLVGIFPKGIGSLVTCHFSSSNFMTFNSLRPSNFLYHPLHATCHPPLFFGGRRYRLLISAKEIHTYSPPWLV